MRVVFMHVCCSLILLSTFQISISSVASSSSSSTKSIATQNVHRNFENRLLQPSSSNFPNPFKSERTIVSGFGSRSIRKTIFGQRHPATSKKRRRTQNDKTDNNEDGDHDIDEDLIPSMKAPKMWVQRPKHTNGNKEDDVLWICMKDEKPDDGSNDVNCVVMKLSFDDENDDWVAKKATRCEESNFIKDNPLDKWIPIDGLYGAYKVPSGVLWILIVGSEAVYEAPTVPSMSSMGSELSPWWQIRRVTNLEIVHLGNKRYHLRKSAALSPSRSKLAIAQSRSTLLTTSRLREEVRQIRLLRKALKQHDFYYIPNNSGLQIVKDMTKSLQQSIIEANYNNLEKSKHEWWKTRDVNGDNQTKNFSPDPRFFWNQHAVEPMLRQFKVAQTKQIANLLLQNVLPLTSAFVGVQKNITVGGEGGSTSYDQILISRRSRFRAGTRFTVRGADTKGDCANFAETEQICLTATSATVGETTKRGKSDNTDESRRLKSVASHIQTRGSIPLRWSSPADVKTYRPRINIGTDPLAQARAVRLHLLDQLGHYVLKENGTTDVPVKRTGSPGVADIVFVNLIDKHSDQGRLGRAFDEVLRAVVDVHAGDTGDNQPKKSDETQKRIAKIERDSVKHVWYDFHAEVKHGRWDRLRLLLDKVEPSLMSHGYFMAHAPVERVDGDNEGTKPRGWSIQRLQNAVVRTNCMDCLDRSNVVQSIFGRYMLFQQLSNEVGNSCVDKDKKKLWADLNDTFRNKPMTLPWDSGEVAHRLLWADNADAISRLYAGTPALKGDFTRTGKRTKRGALDDGMNSLQRYYLNNFLDADRQEGYDLLVGHAAFSNVVEDVSIDDVQTERADPSVAASSFPEVVRESILSDVIEGSSYQNRKDIRDRLEEIGVARQQPELDLRWLPGDLQNQVRDHADELPPNESKGGETDTIALRSRQAIEAIDRRSHAELSWWSKSDKKWLEFGDDDDDERGETKNMAIKELSQHRSQIILTPLQLATVFYLGIKAPTFLGSLAIAILSFVYLPECIKHDFEKQKSFVESKMNRDL